MRIVVRALVRSSWLLLLCLLLGYFGGKKLATLLPPTYQVTALVQLNAQTRTSQIVQPVAAYSALVTSDPVLNPVLAGHRDIDRQTFVSKQLVVSSDGQSQTISIQVTLPEAKEGVAIANQLARLLVDQQNAYIKSQYDKELQILKTRISAEQQSINQLNQQIAQTPPTSTAAIQQLNSQVTQQQNLENQDITSQQTLLTEQALYSAPLSIVQSATLPNRPSSISGLIPIAPVALVVALVLGLAVISFLEQRAGRINGIYTLQQKTAVPVLGSLRWTSPSPEKRPISRLGEAKDPYAEECRVMMADVLFNAEEANAHILAITGLKEASGISTIAAQLATLLAQSKRRVLLIDANLHEPSLHKRLNIPNNAGLGGLLEEFRSMRVVPQPHRALDEVPTQESSSMHAQPGRSQWTPVNLHRSLFNGRSASYAPGYALVEGNNQRSGPVDIRGVSQQRGVEMESAFPLERYVVPATIQNLYVLPAGKPTMNPSSLLSMPEMGNFLRWVVRPIDFVVIDCPDLTHAEAHIVGSLSDQTFLVVDATKDRLKHVVNAREELLNAGVKVAGLLVNKLGRWV